MCSCKTDGCVLCSNTLTGSLAQLGCCAARGILSRQHFEAGQRLFREGQPGTHLHVIRTGQVKLTTALPDGREQIIRLGLPGALLGFEAVEEGTYPYSAEALCEVEACTLGKQDMLDIMTRDPAVCRNVMRMLTRELEHSEFMIRDLGLKNARERVASLLLSLSRGQSGDDGSVPLFLSRQEMAELLGLTAETVSRIMAELQRKAVIIAPRGSIRILDSQRLRRYAGAMAPTAGTVSAGTAR